MLKNKTRQKRLIWIYEIMDKKTLLKNYECACNNIIMELLKEWELDSGYGYWIGGVVGGLYDYDGYITIDMVDAVYCIKNNISRDTYNEYVDYNVRCMQNNLTTMNLNSYIKGAPRVTEDTFNKIEELKKGIQDIIEEEKSKNKNL